jgi:Helix-loop-helix DNA-binding domain
VATLSRHFRGTASSHNGAEPVEKQTPPRPGTNTAAATGVHHLLLSDSIDPSAAGPRDDHQKDSPGDVLPSDSMTQLAAFGVSPDLMDQAPFHSYVLHKEEFDPSPFPTAPGTFDFHAFDNFPDPPPLAQGNPLFDEKESAFMTSFFDTVDQSTSFDHDFQDGLAQWTVPGIDLGRKGFEDAWQQQPPVANGPRTNNNYSTTSVSPIFNLPHYESASADSNYQVSSFPKSAQNIPVTHQQVQPFNQRGQNFISHLHNPNHNPNDLSRTVFTQRNPHQPQSQCDPIFSGYPSVNIPAASPSTGHSAVQTPNSTPKLSNYSYLKHEISSSESPPSVSVSIPPRLSIPHGPPSSYTPSSTSSNSPQPSSKTPRKKRRENLSDHQKRLNHITSEQKRRNLIQQGFNDIHTLVPTLRGQRERGDSKSAVLLKTVEYIRELRDGNDRLRRMLKR